MSVYVFVRQSVWNVFFVVTVGVPTPEPPSTPVSAFRRALTRAAMTTAEWRMPLGRTPILKERLYCSVLLLRSE